MAPVTRNQSKKVSLKHKPYCEINSKQNEKKRPVLSNLIVNKVSIYYLCRINIRYTNHLNLIIIYLNNVKFYSRMSLQLQKLAIIKK